MQHSPFRASMTGSTWQQQVNIPTRQLTDVGPKKETNVTNHANLEGSGRAQCAGSGRAQCAGSGRAQCAGSGRAQCAGNEGNQAPPKALHVTAAAPHQLATVSSLQVAQMHVHVVRIGALPHRHQRFRVLQGGNEHWPTPCCLGM